MLLVVRHFGSQWPQIQLLFSKKLGSRLELCALKSYQFLHYYIILAILNTCGVMSKIVFYDVLFRQKTFTINANPGQCTCCDTLHDLCAGMEGVTSGGGGVMSY